MKKFIVKRPRLVNYINKPESPINIYIRFAYNILSITDKTKRCIVLYKVNLSETIDTSAIKIYCRNNISVHLTRSNFRNMTDTSTAYLFYDDDKEIIEAIDLINPYNKNLNIRYNDNISIKLYTILKKIDNI